MHTCYLFGVEISDFTPSTRALYRSLTGEETEEENYDDENSRFAYERFLVWGDEGTYGPIRQSYG